MTVDINECASGTDNCDEDATCSNIPGSFVCTCNSGFSGDGVTCIELVPCGEHLAIATHLPCDAVLLTFP